jgi:hypothetical protein
VGHVKRCQAGHPMRVEISGKAVGGDRARVVLWYCPTCDYAEHEVRPA